jgi:hypothetical protein
MNAAKGTTLAVAEIERDLWELRLGDEALALYGSAESAVTHMELAVRSDEQLVDLVNARVELLQKSDDYLASVIRKRLARLHTARRTEQRKRLVRGECFVCFEYQGLHWETVVTHDDDGNPEIDGLFWFAIDPMGEYRDATEFTSNWGDDGWSALYDRAIEEATQW